MRRHVQTHDVPALEDLFHRYGHMAEAVANYPQALREALRMDDLTSAAGYLGSTVFGPILPLVVMLYGAFTGSRAVAGDEESGYLDLILAHPVSRPGW